MSWQLSTTATQCQTLYQQHMFPRFTTPELPLPRRDRLWQQLQQPHSGRHELLVLVAAARVRVQQHKQRARRLTRRLARRLARLLTHRLRSDQSSQNHSLSSRNPSAVYSKAA